MTSRAIKETQREHYAKGLEGGATMVLELLLGRGEFGPGVECAPQEHVHPAVCEWAERALRRAREASK